MYIANELVERYNNGDEEVRTYRVFYQLQQRVPDLASSLCVQVKNLLDKVVFIFVPMVNPDGYEVYM